MELSPIAIEFMIYITGILLVGVLASRVTKNIADYILAGRNLSGALTALGAGASDMGGWLLMALPGAAFVNGINQMWMPIGLAIGAYLNWQFEAKRLRIYTEVANNSLTVPAYFDNRFQDHTRLLRTVTAVVVLLFFTVYAAAGFVAGGLLTQTIFHLSYLPALLITASVIIVYTCIGGFVAISWIDFFQGTLIFIALIVVPVITLFHIGPVVSIASLIETQGPQYLNAFHGLGVIGTISLLAWGLGYFGQPHIVVRFMAARSGHDIPQARLICMTWMILAMYGSVFTGILGAAFFNQGSALLTKPETIFLILSQTLFNPWIAGILIAAVLSAIMSTVSAQILSAASALTEDLYRVFLRKQATPRELMIVARLTVLIIAGIALWIAAAAAPNSTILKLVSYAWAGLGASFGPVILISLYWRRMTRQAAVAGIVTGALTVMLWEMLGHSIGGIFTLYSILPGFCLNAVAIYIVTCYSKSPNAAVQNQFDLALAKYRQRRKESYGSAPEAAS